MKITVLQPPYPQQATPKAAKACLQWMQTQLEALDPGDQSLVLLPEYANAPGIEDRNTLRAFAEHQGAEFMASIHAYAQRLGCLMALSALERVGERWFNRGLVIDSHGERVLVYDKTHLTDVEREDLGLTEG